MPAFNAMSAPHTTIIGYYIDEGETGMSCIKHGFRKRYTSQPLTLADLAYEGFTPEEPWKWCKGCAIKHGREHGHEYVIQKSDKGGYEIIDTTFPGGLVLFPGSKYINCQIWLEGGYHGREDPEI